MKKTLAIMLALIMVLAMVPTVAFAEEPYVAWIDGKGYATLEAAVTAAESGATITLGEGKYTLYEKKANVSNKDLTFVGAGTDKTTWLIGPKVPDPEKYGTEYNSDYSFDVRNTEAKETVTFKNMTLQSGRVDYLGFAGTDNTIVEGCIIEGKTFYWGYTYATFTKTTFNCPDDDYALWTYSSPTMTFDNCTFNSSGKVINVYNEGGTPNVTVNFNNCTVNSKNLESLSVMNINDTSVDFTINFTGNNKINDIKADGIQKTDGSHASAADKTDSDVKKTSTQATCSNLFEFNIKYKSPTTRTTVNIDGETVWKDGKMVKHAINDKYTDGYKDNAFTVTPKPNVPGSFDVTCDYCGYTETSTGGLYNDIELERTVKQNSNLVPEDAVKSSKYKVANNSGITVDYTATMNMENLRWLVAGKDVDLRTISGGTVSSPWELLKYLALTEQIDDGRTEVILTFKFDDKIDLGEFEKKYKTDKNVLELVSNMFEMTGVAFGTDNTDNTDNTMTITCKWNLSAITTDAPAPKITLNGYGLPVKNDWKGNKQINIENRGCVGGMVHIKYENSGPDAKMKAETVPNVAANVQVQNTYPPVDSDYTIRIPIVGGCADDNFTLYYGGGSSGDSSGGSSSGGGYYYPTTTPVPVIVIPPKTGDMTVWQSILHFLGIR